jgi:dihydropyrimidinase
MPILFSEGVVKGRIDLNRFVALTATNHAKTYGLYPRKGTIAVGSDADIAIWDPKKKVTITHALLNDGSDYTPYEGLEVTGWPELTMVRGRCIMKDGKLVGVKGFGEFIKREVRT